MGLLGAIALLSFPLAPMPPSAFDERPRPPPRPPLPPPEPTPPTIGGPNALLEAYPTSAPAPREKAAPRPVAPYEVTPWRDKQRGRPGRRRR